MQIENIFSFLAKDVHTVIMATTDENGLPVTCAIDIMDCDEQGLYFLTAKGKNLYKRLSARPYAALTGVKGDSTMTRAAASVRGKVRPESDEVLARLIEKNAYMLDIYPTAEARKALCAFCLCEGEAEWFDLSKKPIERLSFSFGGAAAPRGGYYVGKGCISCGKCLSVCPQNCINTDDRGANIAQEHCLRCGNCAEVCPVDAVIKA